MADTSDMQQELQQIRNEKLAVEQEIQELEARKNAIIQALDELREDEISQKSSGQPDQSLSKAQKLFNTKPKKGVEALIECGEIKEATPASVAQYLHATPLSKAAIGEYLGEHDQFNLDVLREFCACQDYTEIAFDEALRTFLDGFRLPGESQKIDRMMEAFAARYYDCNPKAFRERDTGYVLAFATIMLNTSLHNPNIKDKMTVEQFISMNRGIDNGGDLDEQFLRELHASIQARQFHTHDEGQDAMLRTFVDPEKSGWLTKEGGRAKTWKRRYFILTNNCLYYFESEDASKPKGTIPLENLVVDIVDDAKHKHCFVIRGEGDADVKAAKVKQGKLVQGRHTAYKIAANSPEDRMDWVTKLRAAMTKDPLFMLYRKKKERLAHTADPDA
eukprot:m.309246 g.309246  ORF g.309246 m.309246 type:complete len:390 (+) comp15945_c3_seq2:224-1393(+)